MLWLKPLLVQLQNYLATSVQSWQKEGFRKRTPIFRKKPRELKYQLKIVDTTTESSEDEEEDVQKNNKTTRPLPSQNVDAMHLCADSTETEGDVTDTDNDPGWASLEEEIEATSADGGDDEKESKLRVDSSTSVESEAKFLVFYTMLLTLFLMFCFNCKMGKPKVEMKNKHGTMVTLIQCCTPCEDHPFTWRSQPYVLGRYPARNVLLGFLFYWQGPP